MLHLSWWWWRWWWYNDGDGDDVDYNQNLAILAASPSTRPIFWRKNLEKQEFWCTFKETIYNTCKRKKRSTNTWKTHTHCRRGWKSAKLTNNLQQQGTGCKEEKLVIANIFFREELLVGNYLTLWDRIIVIPWLMAFMGQNNDFEIPRLLVFCGIFVTE